MPIFFTSDLNQFTPTIKPLYYDNDDIIQSIHNIITTEYNTRLFNLSFGSELPFLLQEPMTPTTEKRLEDATFLAIEKYEKRVKIIKVRFKADYEKQVYDVEVVCDILGNKNNRLSFHEKVDVNQFKR